MAAKGKKQERHEHDFYQTPWYIVKEIEKFLPADLGDVLDPAAGNGVFQDVLGHKANTWQNVDIRPEASAKGCLTADFLTYCDGLEYDTIITNPPFSLLDDFIDVALTVWGPERLIYFTRLSALEGVGRYNRIWRHHPPRQVVILPRRPSFTGNGKTDQWAYCWLLWGDVPGSGIAWTGCQ
jgi:hypothetical protein